MKILAKAVLALTLSAFFVPAAYALVDMRNANFSDNWTDFQVKSSGYDLRVQRSYNSRTLFNGMFGFGWCSDFETKLQVQPEGTIRVTECGAGFEIEYKKQNDNLKAGIDKTIATIMAEVRKRNPGRDEKYFKNLELEIRRDHLLRKEFSDQLKLTGQATDGTKYFADGRINDSIVLKDGVFVRSLPNGTFQRFDKNGRLIQLNDRNNNFIKFKYDGARLVSVVDNTGATLNFQYHPNTKYVKTVTGPGGLKSEYTYKGENLISMTSQGQTFKYSYDELNNLTKIEYPDKTTVALTYDKDNDWVMSFKDRRNCVETYKYAEGSKDVSYYKSEVVKKCGDKITNRSSYEFWHKTRKDGSRYLAKSKSVKNGEVTETEYHEIYGRPTLITRNNITTRFEYYPDGLLKSRIEPNRTLTYEYKNSCQKVSRVAAKFTAPAVAATSGKAKGERRPSKAETKTVVTEFTYNDRNCNLVTAKNSEGQTVSLTYDMRGRITKILDQSKKEVLITYEERFGKPLVVSRPGLGTIKFKYKNNGEVDKIDSADEPLVAVQVANIFSNLLEIIAPATTDTTI